MVTLSENVKVTVVALLDRISQTSLYLQAVGDPEARDMIAEDIESLKVILQLNELR